MGNNNQILAIWGSPSSGKTVTAVKIASELAQRKKNVVVVMSDALSPSISTILPYNKAADKSLGNLLSQPSISQESILLNCIAVTKNPYISLIGYKNGDNLFTYPAYSKERAVDLLVLLRHIAEYVIVDCSSMLAVDAFSAVSLEVADAVLRLGNCNLKSLAYFCSYLPLLEDKKYNPSKHIKVLSNVKHYQDGGDYYNAYGGTEFTLPYTESLENQYLSASLFEDLPSKDSKKYQSELNGIIKGVFCI